MLESEKEGRKIIEVLNQLGEARFVGGVVRDTLIAKNKDDVDIAVNLPPLEVQILLEKHKIKCIPTGLKHGTVTAVMNGRNFEITTLRRDVNCDGRHAEVEFTQEWVEDASRRDFTFNALYADLRGEIYDYFGGIDDLKDRNLRFIGDPGQRIEEDYLRILRAFRFFSYLECRDFIYTDLCKYYKENLGQISSERIQSEMMKLFSYSHCLQSLILMQQSEVLAKVLPSGFRFENLVNLEGMKIEPVTKLGCGLDYAGLEQLKKHWKVSNKIFHALKVMTTNELASSNLLRKKQQFSLGREDYDRLLIKALALGKITPEELIFLKNQEIIPPLPIAGKDLIALGINPGKEVGLLLVQAQEIWQEQEGKLTKSDLLKQVMPNLS